MIYGTLRFVYCDMYACKKFMSQEGSVINHVLGQTYGYVVPLDPLAR